MKLEAKCLTNTSAFSSEIQHILSSMMRLERLERTVSFIQSLLKVFFGLLNISNKRPLYSFCKNYYRCSTRPRNKTWGHITGLAPALPQAIIFDDFFKPFPTNGGSVTNTTFF